MIRAVSSSSAVRRGSIAVAVVVAGKQHLGRRPNLGRGHRFLSVTNISDLDATEKFTAINAKSVLYFTAQWCPPCKAIKPFYEELSDKYTDVAFGKIDIDDNQDAAMEYKISSVPTFIFFHGKEKHGQFSGADQAQLESVIKTLGEA
eukprot:CAMPEP_0168177370 /NCGR_PEP_ID=MMETSP0139_2-20121125/8408_1 /TAXON_ID=44445 /ORGANISM="Pseudo-nitzschia australis, Strain 10249 10 AB" /LENGTH=146 /DNA_ID=CAMNT_0008096397 /DNA_START=336 /DNA_END=776 /DNA_ORIENTATION=+